MPAQDTYDELVDEFLALPEVTLGRSLSNEVLKVSDKIFAFRKDERLVVKLPAAQVQALIAQDTGVPFTAGGRTMREWVMLSLPAEGAAAWREWMREAYEYVRP